MDRKHRKHMEDVEQTQVQLISVNPNCSGPGKNGHFESQNTGFQQQMVPGKLCSLWKIFLVCFLACVISTVIGVLIISLVHFGKNNANTSIICQCSQADEKPTAIMPTVATSEVTVITTAPSPSQFATPPQTLQTSSPVITKITQSSTSNGANKISTTATSTEHEAIIDYDG